MGQVIPFPIKHSRPKVVPFRDSFSPQNVKFLITLPEKYLHEKPFEATSAASAVAFVLRCGYVCSFTIDSLAENERPVFCVFSHVSLRSAIVTFFGGNFGPISIRATPERRNRYRSSYQIIAVKGMELI